MSVGNLPDFDFGELRRDVDAADVSQNAPAFRGLPDPNADRVVQRAFENTMLDDFFVYATFSESCSSCSCSSSHHHRHGLVVGKIHDRFAPFLDFFVCDDVAVVQSEFFRQNH